MSGFAEFASGYEREHAHRHAARSAHAERIADSERISSPLDREIALLMRESEAKDNRRDELQRLRTLAEHLEPDIARSAYGERVVKALERAIRQGNFSALEALDRELKRSEAEAAFLLEVVRLVLNED